MPIIYNVIHKEKAMIQNVYLDVYFCFNFLMDFVVILVTSIIVHSRKNRFRITISALIGALYATIILLSENKGILQAFLTYVVMATAMVTIALGKQSRWDILKSIGVLYIVSFSLSGMINVVYYCTSLGNSLINKAGESVFANISISMVLCIVVIFTTGVMAIVERIKHRAGMMGNIFSVTIKVGEKIIGVKALRDTGNNLYEPITKKPVSVIEEKYIESVDKEKLRLIFVPYNTVGRQNGVMEAFIADRMEIDGSAISNTIIGIYKGKLSQNNQYSMILNPSIFSELKYNE